MAIEQLTDEEVRTWPIEKKDRWWLERVFRGDMPQLTLRSAITGFFLGGLLSATNLYVGAKTGWTLGVGLTSVILAFGMFKLLSRLGARDFTILENNCMQSIATAAGYMTAPLVSSLAAYMMVTDRVIPWHQMMLWNIVISLIGVLVAFPMKRRFINDEQQPFPEGRACGVVLDALYTSQAAAGFIKVRALLIAAAVAAGVQFLMGAAYQELLQVRLLGRETAWHLRERLSEYYYELAERFGWWIPKIAGIDIRQLAWGVSLDLAMFGAGGLMGPRIATSLLIGAVINFAIVAPWMISIGEIQSTVPGELVFGRNHLLYTWCLWWGIAMMVVASLTSLFAKPKVIISAFTGLFSRRKAAEDVLRHIELPLWISFVGVPILVFIGVWMGWAWFGLRWEHGLLAIPLIIVLTLIAANSTALTSTTPTGALSKITQFTFGSLDPKNPATNLMTAGMTAEIASNASNLLMDIKPGYMLGAKPRQQAIGHCIGIISGALASTPLFFVLFLSQPPATKPQAGPAVAAVEAGAAPAQDAAADGHVPLADRLVSDKFPMPAAVQWKGVADLIAGMGAASETRPEAPVDDGGGFMRWVERTFPFLPASAVISMFVAGAVALVLEVVRMATKNRLPLSALAIGLGVVIPPDSTIMMFLGAWFFASMARVYRRSPGSTGHMIWIESQEPICAGLIAGAALTGIGDKLVEVFLLG